MKLRRRKARKSGRRSLGWAATSSHPFQVELRRPRWPPFFATSIFLPRFKIKLTNKGEVLTRATLDIGVKAYDGPIGEILTIQEGWLNAETYEHQQWEPGESRRLRVRIKPSYLPCAGTYVVRFTVVRFDPQEVPYKELADQLKNLTGISDEEQKELLEKNAERWKQMGIDPYHRPIGMFKGESIFQGTVGDYFRVEDTSAVLAFWLIIATLLIAVATVLVAVVALAK